MRRVFRCYKIILGAVVLLTSCAYDNQEDLFGVNVCDPEETTYSEVVSPILTQNCTLAQCHDGSNPALPDWTIIENVQANAQLIKQRTGNRTMPPSNTGLVLTAEEISDIACWVDSGAQNN